MSKTVVEKLKEPLIDRYIKQNQDGMDHLETSHVINEANDIFGHAGWGMSTPVHELVLWQDNVVLYKSIVSVTADIDGKSSTKSGTGYAQAEVKNGDVAAAHTAAGKNAEADAIKRAMYKFGYRLGLALYDSSRANVINSEGGVVEPREFIDKNSTDNSSNSDNKEEIDKKEDSKEDSNASKELASLGSSLRKWFSEGVANNSPRKDIVQKYYQSEPEWSKLSEDEQLIFRSSFTKLLNSKFPKAA